eukprot:3719679-Amphidinium_carterae.1
MQTSTTLYVFRPRHDIKMTPIFDHSVGWLQPSWLQWSSSSRTPPAKAGRLTHTKPQQVVGGTTLD